MLTREIGNITIAPLKTANMTTTVPNNLSQGQYHVHIDVAFQQHPVIRPDSWGY